MLSDDYVHDPTTSDTSLAVRKLLCGAASGATSLIFTHPFDVLRRKLQVAGLSSLSPQYTGAIDAMRKSIVAEGSGVQCSESPLWGKGMRPWSRSMC